MQLHAVPFPGTPVAVAGNSARRTQCACACLPRRRGRSIAYSFGARSLASTFRPRARSSSLRAAGYGVLPSVASSSPAWALPAAAHAVLIELDAGAATWHATVHCTAFRAGLYVYVAVRRLYVVLH